MEPVSYELTMAAIVFDDGEGYFSATWSGQKIVYLPRNRVGEGDISAWLVFEDRRPGFLAAELQLRDAHGVVARERFTLFEEEADMFEVPETR